MTDTVNGYTVVAEWTTAGGGQCKWAFAQRGGKQYFIKQFLAPKYPVPDSPGSAATKERKLKQCEVFEAHHRGMMNDLPLVAGGGVHLVVTRDFFREGAKYYKVTDRVDTTGLTIEEIATLTPERMKVVLALSLAHGLRMLHEQNIVHGDLKPLNILPKQTSDKVIIAKLIDFDDSYRVGTPPDPSLIVGDFAYYSPELLSYVKGDAGPKSLGTESDIFALGLVLCQYTTGSLPTVATRPDGSTGTVAAAVLDGFTPATGLEKSWPDFDTLLCQMLLRDPAGRPTIHEVFESLQQIRDAETTGRRTPSHLVEPSTKIEPTPGFYGGKPDESPRLKGKGLTIGTSGRSSSGEGAPRLKGSLLRNRDPKP